MWSALLIKEFFLWLDLKSTGSKAFRIKPLLTASHRRKKRKMSTDQNHDQPSPKQCHTPICTDPRQ